MLNYGGYSLVAYKKKRNKIYLLYLTDLFIIKNRNQKIKVNLGVISPIWLLIKLLSIYINIINFKYFSLKIYPKSYNEIDYFNVILIYLKIIFSKHRQNEC